MSLFCVIFCFGCSGDETRNGAGHSYAPCTNGERACRGDRLQQCDAGVWVDLQDCQQGGLVCFAGSNGTAACTDPVPPDCLEGAQSCSLEQLQVCLNAAWVDETDCATIGETCVRLSDNSAACLSNCQEDAERCGADNDVQRCIGGQWLTSSQCTVTDQLCIEETFDTAICRRDCVDGTRRCSGNLLEICDFIWVAEQPCGIDALCVELPNDQAECRVRQCDDGERRCNADLIELCVQAAWETETDCPTDVGSNMMCWSDGSSAPVCRQRECSGTQQRCNVLDVETCVGGLWQLSQTCVGQEACTELPGAVAECLVLCSPGAARCDGTDFQTCDALGIWQTTETCTDACSEISCGTATSCIGGAGCVDTCASDGSCASGTCLPFYGACQPLTAGTLCDPCTADNQCGLYGDACLSFNDTSGNFVETVCGTACGTETDCPQGFWCDGGQCVARDGAINIHTCVAFADLLAEVSCIPGAGACGISGIDDGFCYLGTCTVGCTTDDQCPEGSSCYDYIGPNYCVVNP